MNHFTELVEQYESFPAAMQAVIDDLSERSQAALSKQAGRALNRAACTLVHLLDTLGKLGYYK